MIRRPASLKNTGKNYPEKAVSTARSMGIMTAAAATPGSQKLRDSGIIGSRGYQEAVAWL